MDETMVPMRVPDTTLEEDAERLNVKLIGWNKGGPSFQSETLHVCAVCFHQTEKTFSADSGTHRILSRSLDTISGVSLCVGCWSELARDNR